MLADLKFQCFPAACNDWFCRLKTMTWNFYFKNLRFKKRLGHWNIFKYFKESRSTPLNLKSTSNNLNFRLWNNFHHHRCPKSKPNGPIFISGSPNDWFPYLLTKTLLVVSYRVKWVEQTLQNISKCFNPSPKCLLDFGNFRIFFKISFQKWFQTLVRNWQTRITFVVCFFPDLTQWFLNPSLSKHFSQFPTLDPLWGTLSQQLNEI